MFRPMLPIFYLMPEIMPEIHAHVLLAEDNAIASRVAARMLEQLGCRVDLASNGRDVQEMVTAVCYDLILMDCEMPEIDGYEATRWIRAQESASGRPRTPVFAVTANAMQGARETCLAAGMDGYVTKPFRKEDLVAALRCSTVAEEIY